MQNKRWMALGLLLLLWCCVESIGTAQEASEEGADELSRAIHRQDLDAYWLDHNMWTEYGYRPHVRAHITPFTHLPRYGQSTGAYAYGADIHAASLKNPYDKRTVQLTKYGTWH